MGCLKNQVLWLLVCLLIFGKAPDRLSKEENGLIQGRGKGSYQPCPVQYVKSVFFTYVFILRKLFMANTIHKKLNEIPAFLAGDHTTLREVLHPSNDKVKLPFSLAWASLEIGESSLPHRLAGAETYYFLEGQAEMIVEDKTMSIEKGDLLHVPPGALQWVENAGDVRLEFLCIVAPPWSAEGEEIETE